MFQVFTGALPSLPSHLPRPPSLADVHLPHLPQRPTEGLGKTFSSLHAHFVRPGGSGSTSSSVTSDEAASDDSGSKMNSTTATSSGASSTTASSTARLHAALAQLRLGEARGRIAGWCPFSDCVLGDAGAHEPPEITYCVVDGDGTLNLQVRGWDE